MSHQDWTTAHPQETGAKACSLFPCLWKYIGRASLVLLATLVLLIGAAQAESVSRRSGYISQFRPITAEPVPGQDVNFKLALQSGGTLTVVLINRNTGAETVLKNENIPSAKNILVTVPGAMHEDNVQYRVTARLVRQDREIGFAEASFGRTKPVARVTSMRVKPSFSPIEGETLSVGFALEQSASVFAYVYDASGTWVRTLSEGTKFPAGANSLNWDGCQTSGTLLDEGDYRISLYCENEAGRSEAQTALSRIIGAAEGAVIGQRTKQIASVLIKQGVYEGEAAKLQLKATAAGTLAIKLKNSTTGASVKLSGIAVSVGDNEIVLAGKNFRSGHTYVLQAVLSSGGKSIGQAQMRFTAGARPPEILSFAAPEEYHAGYGAYMDISFSLGTSGYVTLYAVDAQGKTVAEIVGGAYYEKGAGHAYWNGGDAAGKQLPDGEYTLVFRYSNAAGVSETVAKRFSYAAASGLPATVAQGSIERLMLLSDPEMAERTPVTLRVRTSAAGVLKIRLTRLDTSASVLVCNKAVSKGETDITLDGDYFLAYAYTIDANLFENGSRTGRALVSVHPKIISPVIADMSCDESFGGTWGEACKIRLTTKSNGYLLVRVYDEAGNAVRTIFDGRRASAGEKSFAWTGKRDNGEYAPEGEYAITAYYTDDYGVLSNVETVRTRIEKPVYPEGVYGYSYIGIGSYKTKIYVYSEPGGGNRLGFAYAQSSVFEILEDCGEYLYVKCSRMIDQPLYGYILATQIEKIAVTSPYRFEICINRTGAKAQTLYLYKDNELIDSFKISSGSKAGTTPTGDFLILGRWPYFYSGASLCYDALRVVGGVCIHRVPLVNGSYRSTTAKLGSVASHGCIRVPVEKSSWLYTHIPDSTPVTIYYD